MLSLNEFQELLAEPGVRTMTFKQCPLGAETEKDTIVIYGHVELPQLPQECPHAPRWWPNWSTAPLSLAMTADCVRRAPPQT